MSPDHGDEARESLKDDFFNCKIYTPDGMFCQIEVRARVNLSPADVFAILSSPDNRKVFKSIKSVNARHVLADYKKHGIDRQLVEVDQTGVFRFLFISGTFDVHQFVDQSQDDLVMKFWQATPGFMKTFEGEWIVKPWTDDAFKELNRDLDPKKGRPMQLPLREEIERLYALRLQCEKDKTPFTPSLEPPPGVQLDEYRTTTEAPPPPSPSPSPSSLKANPGTSATQKEAQGTQGKEGTGGKAPGKEDLPSQQCSLLCLRQVVHPSLVPPGPLKHLVRKVCAATVSKIVKDLQAHANQVNRERRAVQGERVLSHQLDDLDLSDEEGGGDGAQEQGGRSLRDLSGEEAGGPGEEEERVLAFDRSGRAEDEAAMEKATADLLREVQHQAQSGGATLDLSELGDRVEGGMLAVAASPRGENGNGGG